MLLFSTGCGNCDEGKAERMFSAYPQDEAVEEINRTMKIHNTIMNQDVIASLCQLTTEKKLEYAGYEVGLPMESHRIHFGWTEDWLQGVTVGKVSQTFAAGIIADNKNIQRALVKTVFNPVNDLDYEDLMVDGENLPLYAFANGDGKPLAPSLDGGTTFAPTHVHYTASEEWTEGAIRDLITNVTEHGILGEVHLYVNRKDAEILWKFQNDSDSFEPYMPPPINPNNTFSLGMTHHVSNNINRLIGYFDGTPVWVKPWVYENYAVVVDTGLNERKDDSGEIIPAIKPLAYRYLEALPGARLAFTNETKPLEIDEMVRYFGIGVANRHMLAVHQFGSKVYTTPEHI
jgi:hypothetical protein